jgi:hypothetical protein
VPDSRAVITVPADGGKSDNWAEWIALDESSAGEILLDLRNLLVASPLLSSRLRALIDWHSFNGASVEVIAPNNHQVRSYLGMMRLGAELPESCSCDLGPIPETGRGKVLIPIRRLSDVQEGDRLDEELGELLAAQFTGTIGRLAEAFTTTASEMCDNATSHGRSAVIGAYVSAQRYQEHCILAIGDLGIGIPDHIRKAHPELKTDDDAIRLATKEGYTGTGVQHRGIGYQYAIDTLKETSVPFGELRVWSGHGRFRVETRDGIQVRRRAWAVEEATAGTWVRLGLSAK